VHRHGHSLRATPSDGWLHVVVAALVVLLLASLTPPALAQAATSIEVLDVDASDHPVVRVTVSAPAELARTELGPADLRLAENGETRELTVTPMSEETVDVVLLIDTSGSMEGAPLAAAKEAARTFVEQMPASARVAVHAFGFTPTVAATFTNDTGALTAAVESLTAGGETALYDGITGALGSFPSPAATRRAIVLLSDGGDTVSTTTLDAAILALSGSAVQLDVVELTSGEADPGALLRLANAAGGAVVSTTEPAALSELFAAIAARLVNRYRLTYTSGAFGTARVDVTLDHAGITASSTHSIALPFAPSTGPTELTLTRPDPTVHSAGLLGSRLTLWFGGSCLFLALAGMLGAATVRRPRTQLSRRRRQPADVRGRILGEVQDILERRTSGDALDARLEAAGMALRPAEWVTLVAILTMVAAAVLPLLLGWVLGLLGAAALPMLARAYLGMRTQRRRDAFAAQLGDSLQLLSGSLRAGYGIMQALESVSTEAPEPVASEFRRVVVEARLGRDLDETLHDLAARMAIDDLEWVVQAIEIHRDVGGDLAEVLDAVAATIRERDEVRGRIKALSAEGRFSAWVMLALPVFMVVMLQVMRPDYLVELTTTSAGWIMIVVGLGLLVVGGLWIRRLVRLVF
jgi:tight adherence protein B